MNHAVEIVGKVQGDLSIKVLASTDFGTNIGMPMRSALNSILDSTHPLKY